MSKRNKISRPTRESEALRTFRKENELSIRKMAERLNLSPTRVHQMESGLDEVNDGYIIQFLEALFISSVEWEQATHSRKNKTKNLRKSCMKIMTSIEDQYILEVYEYLLNISKLKVDANQNDLIKLSL